MFWSRQERADGFVLEGTMAQWNMKGVVKGMLG